MTRFKPIGWVFFLIGFAGSGYGQQPVPDKTYDIVLQFNSICCGVPDDAPLNDALIAFKKENKLKTLYADHISPMGKEGEYYLGFNISHLTAKKQEKLINLLEHIAPLLKDRGKVYVEKNFTLKRAALPPRKKIVRVSW